MRSAGATRRSQSSDKGSDALKGCHSVTEMSGTLTNVYIPGLPAPAHESAQAV